MEFRRKRRHRQRLLSAAFLITLLILASVTGCQYVNTSAPKKIELSESLAETSPESIPDYQTKDCIILNDNVPMFMEADFEMITGETYSELDDLRRCGTAVAMLSRDMMPTEERGSIGQIKPSGWKQAKYEGYVDSNPPYLYNRCHLIAYGLTGQNANEKNVVKLAFWTVGSIMIFSSEI